MKMTGRGGPANRKMNRLTEPGMRCRMRTISTTERAILRRNPRHYPRRFRARNRQDAHNSDALSRCVALLVTALARDPPYGRQRGGSAAILNRAEAADLCPRTRDLRASDVRF